jgi:hypothetical protein
MIVGVDVSSKRIDLAWIHPPDGSPMRWHQDLTVKGRNNELIDRLRRIRIQWPAWGNWKPGDDVTDVVIEYPFAPQRRSIAALGAVVGIVTRQAPPWARVAWPSAGELRQAIGAKNTKASAHEAIRDLLRDGSNHADQIPGWDEHELDALVACIGWTKILEANEAA